MMVGIVAPRTKWALALVFVVIGLLLAASPAHAKTFTVNYRGDATDDVPGDGFCDAGFTLCSLRAAIQEANGYPGVDAVHFDIPDTGVQTIKPDGNLPAVTDRVTIDGYTQPGSKKNTNPQGAINAKPLVEIDGSNSGILDDGLTLSTSGSVVKGLVINRFSYAGILLNGSNNRVEGNFIGTDAAGTQDSGNVYGVFIGFSHSGNIVGGTAPATRNLISGNNGPGAHIALASNNNVQGNLVGTDKSATADLGNSGDGVDVSNSSSAVASSNTVGGSTSARNIIAFNNGDGVSVVNLGDATGNRILTNSIYSNGGLGIDLGNDGVTPNDPKDPDTGANRLQNKPTITSAKAITKKGKKLTSIAGTLNSTPDKSFTVQLFCNPAGTDEGKTLLGKRTVKTNQQGNASFQIRVARNKASVGKAITATATTVGGDTSEFSVPKSVT